jgi:hypothetical protein
MTNAHDRSPRPRAAACCAVLALAAGAPGALLAQSNAMTGATDVEGFEALARTADATVQAWPERSRLIARAMIEEYGEPDSFDEITLTWRGNGKWKKSVVYRGTWPHFVTLRGKDYLEQTIGCRVPAGKVEELKRFDAAIGVDREAGELSARSDSEPLNYLALNLAKEIIDDRRSVEDARAFYRKTAELYESGKSSPYLGGFISPLDDAAAPPR